VSVNANCCIFRNTHNVKQAVGVASAAGENGVTGVNAKSALVFPSTVDGK